VVRALDLRSTGGKYSKKNADHLMMLGGRSSGRDNGSNSTAVQPRSADFDWNSFRDL